MTDNRTTAVLCRFRSATTKISGCGTLFVVISTETSSQANFLNDSLTEGYDRTPARILLRAASQDYIIVLLFSIGR